MPITKETADLIPFFEGLPVERIAPYLAYFDLKPFAAGQRIFKLGDMPTFLAFVISGSLQVQEFASDGRLVGVAPIVAGAAAGWLPMIDNQAFDCDVVAVEDTVLCLAPNQLIKRLVLETPLLSQRLIVQMASALRRITQDKLGLTLPNAYHRVYVQIHKLVSKSAAPAAMALPKQHEIAYMANTSRETVSRALQQLIRSGILVKAGHAITIRKPDELEKLAHDGPDALPSLQTPT